MLLVMFSCEKPTIENSVPDKEAFTTLEMLNLQKDTVIVSIKGNDIYFFEENKVILRGEVINGFSIILPLGVLIVLFLLCVLIGLLTVIILN